MSNIFENQGVAEALIIGTVGVAAGIAGTLAYQHWFGDDDKKSSADAANTAASSTAVDPRLQQATPAVQQSAPAEKAQVVPNAGAQPQAGAVNQNGASAPAQAPAQGAQDAPSNA